MSTRLVALLSVIVASLLGLAAYSFTVAQSTNGFIFRVSVASDGTEANDGSFAPALSADGHVVAFVSDAGNLAYGAIYRNLFFHNRRTQVTTMFPRNVRFGTISYGGPEQLALSGDGRIVALQLFGCPDGPYCPSTTTDVFVYDRQTGDIERVSAVSETADDIHYAGNPALSTDGRIVAFESDADNLVPNDTNQWTDIFVRDMTSGEIDRVSEATDGAEAMGVSWSPALSGDGRLVAFVSTALNLDPQDPNYLADIYIHDRQTGETSLAWKHGQWWAHTVRMSVDGRYLAVTVTDPNYCDQLGCTVRRLYVADLQTGQTLDTLAGIKVEDPVAIATGPVVTLTTGESLLPEDTNDTFDIYRYDFALDELTLVSATRGGQAGADASYEPVMSPDGRQIAFASRAPDLIVGDGNEASDVFVWTAEAHHSFLPAVALK